MSHREARALEESLMPTVHPTLLALAVALSFAACSTAKKAEMRADAPQSPGGATAPVTTAGGEPCGSKTCPPGQVCCNRSCGICAPPDGMCTQQVCEDGGIGGAGTPTCTGDADCRAFSDYCTGCDCRALRKDEKDPTCTGPGVRCFADPCQRKVAVCQAGACVLKPKDGKAGKK